MTKDSRDLELLVTKIQKQLAPGAEVEHDVYLEGRESGRKRQIDVLVRQKLGQYDFKVVIDCKDYKRPVDVKGVEEFYGLLSDVGAQKGVLVCPAGFSETAKTRAAGYQVELYSPFDTDPHKWQVTTTIPSICDFRSAAMQFGLNASAPLPFMIPPDFFTKNVAHDKEGNELGVTYDVAIEKWNTGQFPFEPGEHRDVPIFDTLEVMTDNGYGMMAPVDLYVSLHVTRQLYFGQMPVPEISGFKDEQSGAVITNAFTVGLLSPEQVEQEWQRIDSEDDAPMLPVFRLIGLYGWVEE